jgi:pimeloyl-ACP methyl ester carboxylesterase
MQVALALSHYPLALAHRGATLGAREQYIKGLRSVYRRDGLGAQFVADADIPPTPPKALRPANASALSAPLPASDASAPEAASEAASDVTPRRRSRQERLAGGSWFSEMPYPALTVLLKFPGATLDEMFARRDATLAVYDPYRTDSVDINGQTVPLGANFSAGYGMWLARSDFGAESMASLLLPKYGISEPHVFLMQPFDPNRRIIITLHGLASSPEAWVNVANEIQGDPTLRKNFQLWQVYYPTNVPILVNLADIRQVLLSTLRHFDPNAQTAASHDIVLIGHSMGGVLSKALVSSSGDALWHVFADEYTPEGAHVERAQAKLDPYLRFTPLPGVERAIFIAAPLRGTSFARNPVGRWAANVIELPLTLLDDVEDAMDAMMGTYGAQSANHSRRVPNSVDQLSDDDPMIRALSTLPIAPDVRYNSIIARRQASGPLENTDDGVVPYRSAHLEGAESEYVIRGWHSITDAPQAILELRRILHQDLSETSGGN